MSNIPSSVVKTATKGPGDEYFWRRSQVLAGMEALVAEGYAIFGGDVVAIRDGILLQAIPLKEGGIDGIWPWEIRRRSDEAWSDFCKRSLTESLAVINREKPEEEVKEEFKDYIYFDLEYDRLEDG